MLPKSQRLRKDADISRVYRSGRRLLSPHFSIMFKKNELSAPRIAFVVAKSVSKKATERNLIRRRLAEVIQKSLPEKLLPYDMVVSAKKGAQALQFHEVEREVLQLLKKIA